MGALPPVLRVWHGEHPAVRVRLLEFPHTDALRAASAGGRADLAIGPVPADWDGAVRELGTEEFVVVLPADDDPPASATASASDRVCLADLSDREWVQYAPGNGLAGLVDAACAEAGFRPRTSVCTEQTAAAPLLAAAGLGPALVPANLLPEHFAGRLLRPDPPVRRVLAAYTRPAPDPLATAFIDTLATYVRV
ncbi:LysR family transcriptional regulator substrate-binding protein [Streptomyces sp. P9(2023)]|uniref:LysR family transcriptional regulator substrate-binding protein n=1 Tax=Streptomyces sp. P9(2023) TaxID=3064394 RepID=UPI0028F42E58|nr:LysR family transcriptional regulator substrate-binding protein [Streptomyces sp. P9(2023)]MDT9686816.1 LysR family transcriptional regulator substrate-binding protein [Streptomyces sp. P9(2023)]